MLLSTFVPAARRWSKPLGPTMATNVHLKFLLKFFLLCLLGIHMAHAGGYHFQDLDEMIADVEAIVVGQVSAIDPPTISVTVKETIAGRIKPGPLELDYFLPPFELDGIREYWNVPGSGIETQLEVGQSYILMIKQIKSAKPSLLRAELLSKMELVLKTWRKQRIKGKGETQ